MPRFNPYSTDANILLDSTIVQYCLFPVSTGRQPHSPQDTVCIPDLQAWASIPFKDLLFFQLTLFRAAVKSQEFET
ncbi:hypothetical protein XELAEV_18009873mg [Xenopus laevis]|uniref:Uncharacterized protein n=1 Tax=Xenopus laevis TaxID=8355 RepID=A0A974DTH5_XENLA|nr:hypothetical protein XELAEV_18009873mg [Xenopus laevis]